MEITFKNNACICGSYELSETLFECSDLNFGATSTKSTFLKCLACGSLRPAIFPTADTLGLAYRQYYTTGKVEERGLVRGLLSRLGRAAAAEHRLRSLTRDARSLIDFGCGSGEYLRFAKAERPDLVAFGTDTLKSDHFPQDCATWVDAKDLHRLADVDYATLGHVIEHLTNPALALQTLAQALAPRGRLWIATPNAQSFLIVSLEKWARDVDFPRHRILFSPDQLKALLEGSGFEDVAFHNAPRLNSLANALQSFRNVWRDPALSPAERVKILAKGVARTAVFVVSGRRARLRTDPELIVSARRANGASKTGQ
jgi:SAM-dependent methyltransferase